MPPQRGSEPNIYDGIAASDNLADRKVRFESQISIISNEDIAHTCTNPSHVSPSCQEPVEELTVRDLIPYSTTCANCKKATQLSHTSKCKLYVTLFLIGFIIVGLFGLMLHLLVALCDMKIQLKQELLELRERSEFCMPCRELTLGPFEEDTPDLRLLGQRTSGQEFGKICCANTAQQTQTMLDLVFKRKQLQKCNQDVLAAERQRSNDCDTPVLPVNNVTSAHLLLGSVPKERSGFYPIRGWSERDNVAFLNGIEHLNGRLKINSSGLYFVYSQIYFVNIYKETDSQEDAHVLHHYIYRYNVNLPNGGTEELMHTARTACWDNRKKYADHTSYTAAAIRLQAGDEIFVKVSDVSLVASDPKSNFIGLMKMG